MPNYPAQTLLYLSSSESLSLPLWTLNTFQIYFQRGYLCIVKVRLPNISRQPPSSVYLLNGINGSLYM